MYSSVQNVKNWGCSGRGRRVWLGMDTVVAPGLQAHLDTLEALGFTVEVSSVGEVAITAPGGELHDGGGVAAPIPRQWAAVLSAAMSVGLTLDDLAPA